MKKLAILAASLCLPLLSAQAQFFTNGNLAVVRLSGYDTTTGDGATVIIDQYATNGVGAGGAATPVSSITVPSSGANALIMNGEYYSGDLSLNPSGNELVFAGYNSSLNTQELLTSTSSAVPRVIATLDAYGVYKVVLTDSTNYNSSTINGAASDGTNFWMSGTGPNNTGYNQVVYAGTAGNLSTNQLTTNVFGSGLRSVNVYNVGGSYQLYAAGYVSNGAFSSSAWGSGGYLLSNISGALPTNATGSTNLFPDGGANGGTDLTINPAGTIAYLSDSDIGIVKFTNGGSGWISNYTIVPTNAGYITSGGAHALSVTADWSQNPPVVYATTDETYTNRLVRFQDTGANSIIINLAFGTVSGSVTNTLRGVRFVPTVLYGYVSVQPLPYVGNPGQTATFSVGVLGSPAPAVQWYSNSVANPTYVAITGATSTNLSLANISTAQSGSLFYAVVSNVYGMSTSTPVSLTVNNPSISVEPMGMTNFPNSGSYSICVTASGTGTLAYQWFSNGVAISGANAACYTVPNSAVSNSTSYTVVVTNTSGATVTTATSTPAIVSYSPYLLYDTFSYANGIIFDDAGSPWTEESGTAPIYETNGRVQIDQGIGASGTSFIQSLFSQPVPYGSTVMWASFTINLKTLPSSPGGAYIGYFQDTNFDFYGRIVAVTSNNPTYTPDISPVAYPGTYRIGIANKSASIPSAVVELDMATNTDYQVVEYFDMQNNFCQVAVNPAQTDYNNVYSPGPDLASPLVSAVAGDGFTPTTLPMVAYGLRQATAAGVIQLDNLQVSDDWNGGGSGFAAVTAASVPAKPVVGFISPGFTNYVGNSNILEVAASGIGVTYQWYQGATMLTDGGSFSGSATPVLIINPESGANSGNYTCVVSNSAGATTSAVAVVSINTTPTPPMFTLEPVSTVSSLGANVTFTANAVGTGPITYQWNQNGSAVGGATGSSYTLTRISTNMSGYTYSVTASGGASPSTTSTNAVLTVNGPIETNIAYLRSLQITNAAPTITIAASNSVAVYQVTGVVIDYTNIESATYAEYWIQDATGGIEFFVTDPSFRPHYGDVISATGVVDTYDDALELDGSANNPGEPYSIVSTNGENSPLPYPSELIPFGFAQANPGLSSLVYQGSRATFTNCYFTTPGTTFSGNATYTVTNSAGQSYELYIAQSAGPDLAGTTVPTFAYSITGAFDQFDSEYELNVSSGLEVVTAPPPPVTNLTASISGTNVSLNWTAVPASYTYSVWSTTNLSVPFAPLAPGLWFGTSNGTYSGTVPTNSPTRFYEIVSP